MDLPGTAVFERDPAEPAHSLAAKLAAISHPARIEILRHLSSQGCCCCKDVVDTLDLAQSTVSQHLKVLVSSGLVRYAPDRQRSLYAIDRDAAASLFQAVSTLLETCCAEPSGCGFPGNDKKK
jgi:DNA-binding transcriptional ArsR family regulator